MDYSISNLKDDLAGILHSVSLDKVRNQFELINRGGRVVISKIDPDMTKRIAQITNAVHNSIFDYTAPADLKGTKVSNVRFVAAPPTAQVPLPSKEFILCRTLAAVPMEADNLKDLVPTLCLT